MDDNLTTKQAASSLGIHYQTLMRMVYDGKIKAKRWGRYWLIHKNEVERKRRELAA